MIRNAVPLMSAPLAAAMAVATPAMAATNIDIGAKGPVIELYIIESIAAEPDMVTIGAGVSSEAPTATEALRLNSAEMVKVIDRLKKLGVAERDIQTTGISLNARYDYESQSRRRIFLGYEASNRVSVKLREIAETGGVLDALVAAGATDLKGPSFSLENDEAAQDAARKRALERAKARAEDYAMQLGFGGARVLAITENITGRSPMLASAMVPASANIKASAPPVQPGMVETSVSLTISYELVNGASSASAAP